MKYDHEKENHKVCPVCDKVIDYHFDGFMHDKVLNVWICRDHNAEEVNKSIVLKDPELMRDLMKLQLTEKQAIKLGWKPYPQLGTYLRITIWNDEECIECAPMNKDHTMNEEEAGDVDSWNELYIELYKGKSEPNRQQLIDDIKKPYTNERPIIEVRDTSGKEAMEPMAPFLKQEWCSCEKPEFLCYPEDGACPCGEYKHHVHCKNCGAISQTG